MQTTPNARFYRILAIVMQFVQVSAGQNDNLSAAALNSNGYESAALDSCKFKCGQAFALPCSCDVTCLIYRNCCEDMESVCPHVLLESREKFRDQFNSQLDCTYNGYLFISSCPDNPTDIIGSRVFQQDSFDFNSTIDSITYLYDTVLVTDLKTGLTYKNYTIFTCNAANGSRPAMWQSYIDNVRLGPMGILEKGLQDTDFQLFNPPSYPKSTTGPARCIQSSIDTCSRDSFDNYTELTRKCQAFKSYVKLTETVHYDNIYCAMCNRVNRSMDLSIVTRVYIKQNLHNFNFAIIGTVNKSSLTLTVIPGSTRSKCIPWSTMVCSHSNKTLADDITCAIMSCAEGFRKRPDGQCKKLHTLLVAFPEEEIAMSEEEMHTFPDFLLCFLRNSNHDVERQRKRVDVYFDKRLKKTFYVTQLWQYDSDSILQLNNDRLILTYFLHFKMAIATFKSYQNSTAKLRISEIEKTHVDGQMPLLETKDLLTKHMLLEKYFVLSYAGKENASLIPICVDHFVEGVKTHSASEVARTTSHKLLHCVYSENVTNEWGEILQGKSETRMCLHAFNSSGLGAHLIYSVLISSFAIMIHLTKN